MSILFSPLVLVVTFTAAVVAFPQNPGTTVSSVTIFENVSLPYFLTLAWAQPAVDNVKIEFYATDMRLVEFYWTGNGNFFFQPGHVGPTTDNVSYEAYLMALPTRWGYDTHPPTSQFSFLLRIFDYSDENYWNTSFTVHLENSNDEPIERLQYSRVSDLQTVCGSTYNLNGKTLVAKDTQLYRISFIDWDFNETISPISAQLLSTYEDMPFHLEPCKKSQVFGYYECFLVFPANLILDSDRAKVEQICALRISDQISSRQKTLKDSFFELFQTCEPLLTNATTWRISESLDGTPSNIHMNYFQFYVAPVFYTRDPLIFEYSIIDSVSNSRKEPLFAMQSDGKVFRTSAVNDRKLNSTLLTFYVRAKNSSAFNDSRSVRVFFERTNLNDGTPSDLDKIYLAAEICIGCSCLTLILFIAVVLLVCNYGFRFPKTHSIDDADDSDAERCLKCRRMPCCQLKIVRLPASSSRTVVSSYHQNDINSVESVNQAYVVD